MVKKKSLLQRRGIGHSVNNILLGNGSKKSYKGRYPFEDYDKDGVANIYDCNPYDKNQQGIIKNIGSSLGDIKKGIVSLFTGKSAYQQQKEETEKKVNAILNPPGTRTIKTASAAGSETATSTITTTPTPSPTPSHHGGGSAPSPTPAVMSYLEGTNVNPITQQGTSSVPSAVRNKIDIRTIRKGVIGGTQEIRSSIIDVSPKRWEEKRKGVSAATGLVFAAVTPNLADKKYQQKLTSLDYSQQLPYQQRGTINLNLMATTADMKRLQYFEQAAEVDIQMIGFEQQIKLDQIAEKNSKAISDSLIAQGEREIKQIQKELQNKVNKEEISVGEANKRLDNSINAINTKLDKLHESQLKEIITPYVKEATDVTNQQAEKITKEAVKNIGKRDAPSTFLSSAVAGVAIGAVSTIATPIGIGLTAVGLTGLATSTPEIISSAKENPYGFGASVAGGIFGGVGGAMIGRDIVNYRNTVKVNNYLAKNMLNEAEIKKSFSVSVGKAIKVGKDINGKTIWEVETKGMTKFTNARTGKIIDQTISIGTARVISETSGEAMKSVVDATSVNLKVGGWKVIKKGNVITAKGQTSFAKGTSYTFPSKVEGISGGYGEYDIYTGTFSLKGANRGARDFDLKVKAEVSKPSRYSSTQNFISKMIGKYTEAKRIKGAKIYGTEEMYGTLSVSDVFENYVPTKSGTKVKYYPTEEIKIRDVGKSYMKSFTPQGIQYGNLDFSGSALPQDLQLVYKISPKASAKLSAQSAQQVQMSAVANDISKALVGKINKGVTLKAAQQIIKPSTKLGITSGVLIESNYPTYLGGTKYNYGGSLGFSLTGNVVNDYSTGKNQLSIEKQKTISPSQVDWSKRLSNLAAISPIVKSEEKIKTSQRTKASTAANSVSRILLGEAFATAPRLSQQQRQIQQQKLQQRQMQKITFKNPPFTFTIPKIVTPNFTFGMPPFTFGMPPQKAYGYYGRRQRSKKSRGRKKAYQSSLGAYQLGISMKRGYKTKGKFSGLELRPLWYEAKPLMDKSYIKKINKLLIS